MQIILVKAQEQIDWLAKPTHSTVLYVTFCTLCDIVTLVTRNTQTTHVHMYIVKYFPAFSGKFITHVIVGIEVMNN